MDSSETRTVGFVGRCKTCKTGHRKEIEEVVIRRTQTVRTPQGYPHEKTIRRYAYPAHGRPFPAAEPLSTTDTTCCGARLLLRRVKATITAHVCDARCMSATGPNCECSCGGKNHGAGNLLVLG